MSVTQTLRAVELLRSFGVAVTFESGWETRGNGQSSAYQGGIIHHTGGSYASTCPGILIHGRSDLSGPLCNFAGLSGGGIHVVAAHPANHAGASGGPSNGPFPVTSLFNKLVMGLEICYPGNDPMTNEQYRTAKVFAKAMAIMYGSIERARGHGETSIEGKWDPGWSPGQIISMADLRAAAANVEGDDMPTPGELWGHGVEDPNQPGVNYAAFDWLRYGRIKAGEALDMGHQVKAEVLELEAKVEAKLDALADQVSEVQTAVAALQTGTGYSLADLVKAINDDADRRDRDGNPSTGQVS